MCRRHKTEHYPLRIQKHKNCGGWTTRIFGNLTARDVKSRQALLLCDHCVEFLKAKKPKWQHAWPAVLYTLMDKITTLLPLLPHSFTEQYSLEGKVPLRDQSGDQILWGPPGSEGFQDLTPQREHFQKKIQSGSITDLRDVLDETCHRSVRCPCGATTFLENVGCIPFQHYISSVEPSFVSFGARAEHFLALARGDWITRYNILGCFDVSPAIFIHQEQGLCLATCPLHNGGSSRKLLHLPTNPVERSVPSKRGDSLAMATVNLRQIKPITTKFRSTTFQMVSQETHVTPAERAALSHRPSKLIAVDSYINFLVKIAMFGVRLHSMHSVSVVIEDHSPV